jgi:serine/threonine protein kinase
MSYCLNPVCQQPKNPDSANFCQTCGSRLRLAERYRAIRLIGQGGFGRTFLAVDESVPSQPCCVIKQFLPTNSSRNLQKAAELFRQEAERLAELGRHPQIPRLLAHFEQADGQYLVQEFIDGQNLAEVLAEEGPFSETEIRELLDDLLPVLRFIHSYQVIHRDVKPENIIRPKTGDRLVLVDFGASKYATGTALIRTGTVIGSAGFVAPEQAIGRAEFASDLYSLGVTCVHLLTAMHPFDLYSVSEDDWVWHQYLVEPVSTELKQVLDRLLQRATSQRYQTATEVLKDLSAKPGALRTGRSIATMKQAPSRATESSLAWARPPRSIELGQEFGEPSRQSRSRQYSQNSQTTNRQLANWQCMQTLLGFQGGVTAIAISPDGQTLASSSTDKTIRLWNLFTGELEQTLGRSLWFRTGHTDRINALAFVPDGRTLISGSDDSNLILWNLSDRRASVTLDSPSWIVSAIALTPDGQFLGSGSGDGKIHLWHLPDQELIATLDKHRDRITSLVVSPDGQTLVSSSYDKTVRLWDLQHDQLNNTLLAHSDRVNAIAICPAWRTMVSGSSDRNVKIWDLNPEEPFRTLAAHTDSVNCLTFHPNGQLFASGSEDRTINLWDAETGDRLSTLRHAWGVNTLAFSPDGEVLVSGSSDETIKIWRQAE